MHAVIEHDVIALNIAYVEKNINVWMGRREILRLFFPVKLFPYTIYQLKTILVIPRWLAMKLIKPYRMPSIVLTANMLWYSMQPPNRDYCRMVIKCMV